MSECVCVRVRQRETERVKFRHTLKLKQKFSTNLGITKNSGLTWRVTSPTTHRCYVMRPSDICENEGRPENLSFFIGHQIRPMSPLTHQESFWRRAKEVFKINQNEEYFEKNEGMITSYYISDYVSKSIMFYKPSLASFYRCLQMVPNSSK